MRWVFVSKDETDTNLLADWLTPGKGEGSYLSDDTPFRILKNIALLEGANVPILKKIRDILEHDGNVDKNMANSLKDWFIAKAKEIFKDQRPVIIVIHWGKKSREIYDKLDSIFHKHIELSNESIYFTYFSSLDDNYNMLLKSGNVEERKAFLDYYYGRATGWKKNIYECMESILIKTYPFVLKEQDIENIDIISSDVKALKIYLNEVRNHPDLKPETIDDILKTLDEITSDNLKKFRSSIVAILKDLPGTIY